MGLKTKSQRQLVAVPISDPCAELDADDAETVSWTQSTTDPPSDFLTRHVRTDDAAALVISERVAGTVEAADEDPDLQPDVAAADLEPGADVLPVDGISDDIARADDHARAQRHARPDGADAIAGARAELSTVLASDARPQWFASAIADLRAIADAVRSAYTGADTGTNGETDRSSDDEARHHPSDGWLPSDGW